MSLYPITFFTVEFDFAGRETCLQPDDFINNRPKPELFMDHVRDFLSDNPHGTMCSSAGHPAYGNAVKIVNDTETGMEVIGATHYMAYHTILRTSEDFTNALDWAYQLTDSLTKYLRSNSKYSPNIEVFPYRCLSRNSCWVYCLHRICSYSLVSKRSHIKVPLVSSC